MKHESENKTGFCAFLATSFLGAFNDNCFKLLVTCFALSRLGRDAQNNYIPLAGALFILPYLVCTGYTGYVSDRFSKRSVIIWSKWLELAIMLLGLLLFFFGAIYSLLGVLFLMGAQSALYSPAKYGYLPETMDKSKHTAANGYTQFCTFFAIIAGMWVGGNVSAGMEDGRWWLGSLCCVGVAAAGIVTSYFTARTPEGSADAVLKLNPLSSKLHLLAEARKQPLLLVCLVFNSFFWFVVALAQNNLPLSVIRDMNLGERELGHLLVAVGVGISLGCLVSGKISRKGIAFRTVVPAGILLGLFCIVMSLLSSYLLPSMLVVGLIGFFAGLYHLPLITAIQAYSIKGKLGSCIALGNSMDCIGMILSYVLQWVLIKPMGLAPRNVFLVLGFIVLAVVSFIWMKFPLFRNGRTE